jgi:hypothetical protein
MIEFRRALSRDLVSVLIDKHQIAAVRVVSASCSVNHAPRESTPWNHHEIVFDRQRRRNRAKPYVQLPVNMGLSIVLVLIAVAAVLHGNVGQIRAIRAVAFLGPSAVIALSSFPKGDVRSKRRAQKMHDHMKLFSATGLSIALRFWWVALNPRYDIKCYSKNFRRWRFLCPTSIAILTCASWH